MGVGCAEIWYGGGGLDVRDQQLMVGLMMVVGVCGWTLDHVV